jgi:hypothetical protein
MAVECSEIFSQKDSRGIDLYLEATGTLFLVQNKNIQTM